VALTCAAWERCVTVPPCMLCQDEGGRLWVVLWMLRLAIGRSDGGRVVPFALHVRNDNRERPPPAGAPQGRGRTRRRRESLPDRHAPW
jgi:hypothetical protein